MSGPRLPSSSQRPRIVSADDDGDLASSIPRSVVSYQSDDGAGHDPIHHIDGQDELQRLLLACGETSATAKPRRTRSDPQVKDQDVQKQLDERPSTQTFALTITASISPITYGIKYWRDILNRLDANHIRTSRMIKENFDWMLPQHNATQRQLSIYQSLLVWPMTVSTMDLETIMQLELSTASSPPTAIGSHYSYIRSWTLTSLELKRLIEFMQSEGNSYAELREWDNNLQMFGIDAGPRYFTIRYVGKCIGPTRPYDRYEDDILQRTSGILHEFMHSVEMLLPKVAKAAQVHLIKLATIDWSSATLAADDVERVLIEFFGHSTLLNRQRGGNYASYVPSREDRDIFIGLKTNFYRRLKTAGAMPLDEELWSKVDEHFQDIKIWTETNPDDTGVLLHRFTDGIVKAAVRQATPREQVHGVTILAMLGKDISLQDYIGRATFLESAGRAGTMTRDFVRRLARNEATTHNVTWREDCFRPEIPFADLWPCLKHKLVVDVIDFLRRYLSIIRPLIAVAFSREVTSVARANLKHDFGVRTGNFVPLVGELTIQHYGDETDDAFIVIPHIHGGRDKYGSQQTALRRVFDLTWQLTFLVANEAISVVQSHAKDDVFPTRLQLCKEVLAGIERTQYTKGGQRFFRIFEEAKADLKALWSRNQMQAKSEGVRSILDSRGRRGLAALGYAEGEPGTTKRRIHVESFWTKNLEPLHLNIPHVDERKDEWIEAFMPLQVGQSYYLQVLSKLGDPDEYVQALLAQCPATASTQPLDNSNVLEDAVLRCGLWIHEKNVADKKKLVHGHFPDRFLKTSEIQGHNIGIHEGTGKCQLRWHRTDGSRVTLGLFVGPARAKNPTDVRALSFTEHGIDVVDANGKALRTQRKGGSEEATIPRKRFLATESGALVLDLWKAVREHLGYPVSEGLSVGPPAAKWSQVKGVKMLSAKAQYENLVQNRPVQRQDANYLLNEFLLERFTDGGTFHCQDNTRSPDSLTDLQAFVVFLRRPEWSEHPFSGVWINHLDKKHPNIAMLSKNLEVLRSCIEEDTQAYKARPGQGDPKKRRRYAWETSFQLGSPGSGPSTPITKFEKGKGNQAAGSKQGKGKIKSVEQPDDGSDKDSDYSSMVSAPASIEKCKGHQPGDIAKGKAKMGYDGGSDESSRVGQKIKRKSKDDKRSEKVSAQSSAAQSSMAPPSKRRKSTDLSGEAVGSVQSVQPDIAGNAGSPADPLLSSRRKRERAPSPLPDPIEEIESERESTGQLKQHPHSPTTARPPKRSRKSRDFRGGVELEDDPIHE
ncbi:hypothetical protein BJ546DRAFT_1099832 [Cryomyces antarcticus]|nr:hypothetical protein LTR39_000713 [Cryomyces antarcticus]